MQPPATTTEKVPLITKFAFGAGDVGPAIATAIMSFFLLFFLTDVARLDPAVAGVILLLTKIWDAVNDPIVCMLSDRIKTRWGRRRPWFLFGAIPFGLTFFLLFIVPQVSNNGKFWYYLVISLLLDTAFTVVNVPYTALTPELTRDYDERTSLNSFRFAFSIGSGLIAAVVHPIIVSAMQPTLGIQGAYAVSAGVWAVAATLPFFFAFWGTYERHQPDEEEDLPFREALKITFANRAFRYVTGIYLLSWLVVQTVSTIVIYYMTYWLRQPGLVPVVILAVQGSALIWLFIWTAVSRRTGKKGVYYRGMIFWIVVAFALFAVQPGWPSWVIIALAALAGVGVATAYLVPWAMLPDVIELDELETGKRREGAFYGFFVLLQKLGLALGLFLVSQVLNWTGYITPPEGITAPIVQPDSALLAIRLMIGPLPALILAAGIFLVYKFPITKENHEQALRELARRRAAAAPTA
ncbi:MFS transporter [Candidatus Amarolinea aalborgensis]|uniref:MFS transporter n=1 Tax=Candidatus Amarolinea aalborgensis TaxID=2249329 RepID=UPI003BF9D646